MTWTFVRQVAAAYIGSDRHGFVGSVRDAGVYSRRVLHQRCIIGGGRGKVLPLLCDHGSSLNPGFATNGSPRVRGPQILIRAPGLTNLGVHVSPTTRVTLRMIYFTTGETMFTAADSLQFHYLS